MRTCLVLSVGADKGIAHLGAIAAVKQLGIPIQCVVGNSMGALVGGLYVTAPTIDTAQRYREFMASYIATTKAEADDRGAALGLLGAGLVLLSGGAAWPILAGGGIGYVSGAGSVDVQDFERFNRVLNAYYRGVHIEWLPVPFATMHEVVSTENGGMVDVRSGNLAEAVKGSVANPLLFPRLDPRKAGVLDPGVDRVAVTPVEDACRMFPHCRLIAINVSGQPVFTSNRMDCQVVEIDVPVVAVDHTRVLKAEEPEFSAVVNAGYRATLAALTSASAKP
jgi:NTE family protein